MLNMIKNEADITYTENGAVGYSTSGSFCLDLFFGAGAMRNCSEKDISDAVIRAYTEDPEKTMKIIFFARDIRGGLGERHFFRTAVKTLASFAPESVKRNLPLIPEYGRFDDLCALIGTPCEAQAIAVIREQLAADISAMERGGKVSLLAKWLPSANASSHTAKQLGRTVANRLRMSEKDYRKTLSALRKYSDILENRLRTGDYSFDYEHQCSRALFKYRKAFIRNDCERYRKFIKAVNKGEVKLNADTLFPYDIVRCCMDTPEESERAVLDAAWKSLTAHSDGMENALAVIDGSGSMTVDYAVRPIDAALSLGIYFAEHSKGAFADHFITFSCRPRLVKIQGDSIYEKVQYCSTFNEVANTDLNAVFELILRTAVKNKANPEDMPSRLYIFSDMEFDECVYGGESQTLFEMMKTKFAHYGYKLPQVIFWNLGMRSGAVPVKLSETGAALVSGFSPSIFGMMQKGDISPVSIMNEIIYSERYERVS